MTDTPDNPSSKPISVAELLAKNGNIGSPPVGGRRRRRRGDADSVSVAELTGEIPIYSTGEIALVTGDIPVVTDEVVPEQPDEADEAPDPAPAPTPSPADENGEPGLLPVRRRSPEERGRAAKPAPPMTQAEADYAEHLERRRADRETLDYAPPVRRKMTTGRIPIVGGDAEQMSPDPEVEPEQSYVRSSGKLFGGQPSDDVPVQTLDEIENVDEDDDHDVMVRPARES